MHFITVTKYHDAFIDVQRHLYRHSQPWASVESFPGKSNKMVQEKWINKFFVLYINFTVTKTKQLDDDSFVLETSCFVQKFTLAIVFLLKMFSALIY